MPLSKKIPIIIFAIVTGALSLLGSANFFMQRSNILDFHADKALDMATSFAIILNGDSVESALKNGEKNSEWGKWKNMADEMLSQNELTYLYVMAKPQNDSVKYYISATDRDGSIDFLEGEPLEEFDDIFLNVYKTGKRSKYATLFESQKYGWLVSAYAPVKNSNGEVVVVVGADIDMLEVKREINLYGAVIFGMSAILGVLVFFISVRLMRKNLIEPLNSLVYAAKNFSLLNKSFDDLNFNYSIEFKELADTLKDMEHKINKAVKKSFTDSLSKLHNRDFFRISVNDILKTEVSKSLNKNEALKLGAFFVIDIDYFKQVNDNYGHERGDTVIRSVAKVLQNTFGDEDEIVARIGGDEFAAFCPDIKDNSFIEIKCQKIRSLMQEVRYAEDKPPVTLSIGIVNFRYGEDDSQFSDLFNRADNALYDVKARGRNGWEICE